MEAATGAPETPQPAPTTTTARPEEQRRKWRLYIAGTISAGLLIATGYLGARIFVGPPQSKAAEPAATPALAPVQAPTPAATPVVRQSAPVPVKPAANPVKAEIPVAAKPDPFKPAPVAKAAPVAAPSDTSAANEGVALPAPHRSGIYLQIGAINTPAVAKYISELRRDQWEPIVVEGPRSGIERVLVGPFADRSSLEAAKARLQALGIDYFVRAY